MEYRFNIGFSKTTSQDWTLSAIDCYNLGCNCSKCNLYKIYFSDGHVKCRMKNTVIELVRRLGTPVEV